MGNEVSSVTRQQIISNLQGRTNFTSKELQRLYRRFREDCRKNGHRNKLEMNLEEFTTILKKSFEEDAALNDSLSDISSVESDEGSFEEEDDEDFLRFAEHAFRSFDLDQNGRVDFEEYIMTLDVQLKASYRARVENLFSVYDIDGDAMIAREEVREILQVLQSLRLGCLPKEDVITPELLTNVIFKRADANGDDVISKKEFVRAATQSATVRSILEGTSFALSQPFVVRAKVTSTPSWPRTTS